MTGFAWLWLALSAAGLAVGLLALVLWRYTRFVVRIFEEKPLFIVPRGQPYPEAEEIRFRTADGVTLCGSYLHGEKNGGERRGVILFGVEFGANRWSCVPYCRHLLEAGYDVFAFDFRSQGQSDPQPGYEPMQWVTDYEAEDMRAAIAYLRKRPDADPHGIGFFGISRGGGAGLVAGANDPYVCCFVTDGAFGTLTTMVPYMRKWARLYVTFKPLVNLLPEWLFHLVARFALWQVGRKRRCRFPSLERAIARISPRPLLMIHGAADTYIKPEIAQALFAWAGHPKEFWLVERAKHNQALQVRGEEYRRRVLEFFDKHLGCRSRAGREAVARSG
ncbi:MAG: alpha/beta fold hydrolase [Gemmatales bacterium]|nr:alpha/beta fold hydrolase [Gemmatales bacterium]MDW8386353.1 alpha/beta fold hydrolase [Gemmatales bacterium]